MWSLSVLGGLLVLLAAYDVVQTVLHPAGRGPVTLVTTTSTWYVTRTVARLSGRHDLLVAAGPLAILAVLVGWVVLVWVGFALVYLPWLDSFSYAPTVPFDDTGVVDALYASGTALTTVGFGDVVAGTDALRLATTVEAATGFGLFTAAVTYLLSLYPLISGMRTTARTLSSQAQDPARAAELVLAGGTPYLQTLQAELIGLDEDTHRFPLLHYFHPRDRRASLATLVRGATMVCLQARWGLAREASGGTRVFGEELRTAIERLIEHYADRIGFREGTEGLDRELDAEDARRRFRRLAEAAGDAGERTVPDDEELSRFAALLGRSEAFLESLAGRHLYEYEPLLRD